MLTETLLVIIGLETGFLIFALWKSASLWKEVRDVRIEHIETIDKYLDALADYKAKLDEFKRVLQSLRTHIDSLDGPIDGLEGRVDEL